MLLKKSNSRGGSNFDIRDFQVIRILARLIQKLDSIVKFYLL